VDETEQQREARQRVQFGPGNTQAAKTKGVHLTAQVKLVRHKKTYQECGCRLKEGLVS
jgi:hypothetical protein